MQIQITGKQIELGDSLRSRIETGLEATVTKYFDRPTAGNVVVSKDRYEISVDCSVNLPSGIVLQARGTAAEPYAALETALDKMEKRVRRYKRRLKDHHKTGRSPLPSEIMPTRILQSMDEESDPLKTEGEGGDQPLIIAETAEKVLTLSVAEAVMQLELGETSVVFFKNSSHDRFNLVYRRSDGHIGWVDPTLS